MSAAAKYVSPSRWSTPGTRIDATSGKTPTTFSARPSATSVSARRPTRNAGPPRPGRQGVAPRKGERHRASHDEYEEREDHVGGGAAVPGRVNERREDRVPVPGIVDEDHAGDRRAAKDIQRFELMVRGHRRGGRLRYCSGGRSVATLTPFWHQHSGHDAASPSRNSSLLRANPCMKRPITTIWLWYRSSASFLAAISSGVSARLVHRPSPVGKPSGGRSWCPRPASSVSGQCAIQRPSAAN